MDGSRIKEARKKMGYTLAEVAEKTGYSIGFISQIERNLKMPSLTALRKIADCLECSEVWLLMSQNTQTNRFHNGTLREENNSGYMIPSHKRMEMRMPEINTHYEIFTPSSLPGGVTPKMTGMYVRLNPGCWVTEQMIAHRNTDESVFLLKGCLEAHMGSHIFIMKSGDNLYIPGGMMHNYINTGDDTALILVYFSALIY